MDASQNITLIPCDSYTEEAKNALIKAIAPYGWPEKAQGKRIIIKVNLVHGSSPEKAVVTHPSLVKALAEILVEAGAVSVIIGDSPGGLYNASYVNHVYKASQMTSCESEQIKLNQNFDTANATYPDGIVLHDFIYTDYLKDYDYLIDFCKLKTHGMMGLSAAVKNMFGTIPGTTKPEYHLRFPNQSDFSKMIIDIFHYWHPDLCLVDAIDGMEGNGPTQGTPRHIGCIVSGENGHLVDLCCAKLIGLSASEVPTLAIAKELGLLTNEDEEQFETQIGKWQDLQIKDYHNVAVKADITFSGKGNIVGRFTAVAVKLLLQSKPNVKKKECIGCRHCAQICPAKAITMKNGKPSINRSNCIKCFCCQEFCPVGAMKVHRTLVARALVRNK